MIKTPLSTMIGGAFWTPKATILGGVSKSFDQLIKSIFANNEQGFAYDPNDLSTMFQDAAGTVPVIGAGQPVGLMLDKSGRGNHARQTTSASRPIFSQKPILTENIVPQPVNLAASDWSLIALGTTATASSFTVTGAVGAGIAFTKLEVGREYQVNMAWESSADTSVEFRGNVGGAAPLLYTTNARKASFIFKAGSTNLYFRIPPLPAPATFTFSNVSIREVTGYRTDQNYIEYDGVDDKLITTLPAQLTGCTVIRSVPNAGTQILTGQTIPTPYNDNTDHCGLIVINRALTATETAAITSEFNKRAGV